MSLLSVDDLKPLIDSPLNDKQLQNIIDRVEADVADETGAPYDGTAINETIEGNSVNIFTKRPISSVSSVTEYAALTDTSGTSLTEGAHFFVWARQGRLQRIGGGVRAAPSPQDVFFMSDAEFASGRVSGGWGAYAVVSYVPTDQRTKRRQAVIDLVRFVLAQPGLKSESVGGEYSYTALDNYEAERRRVMRRLTLTRV